MHEDVCFHTTNWGAKVIAAFNEDSDIGVVGAIGSQFLPNELATWWGCGCCVGSILQGQGGVRLGVPVDKITECVVVDGFWMCLPRTMFVNSQESGSNGTSTLCFDARTFNSFHCYDIDICMQTVNAGKKVVILPDIDIQHFSWGNVRSGYTDQLERFYQKWSRSLPICRGVNLDGEAMKRLSYVGGAHWQAVWRCSLVERTIGYRIEKFILRRLGLFEKITGIKS